MKKRLFSLLLALCMLMGMLPTAALAADGDTGALAEGNVVQVNGTNYAALTAAITNAVDGDTVQLTADITGVEQSIVIDKNLTLDLAGHTLSGTVKASKSADAALIKVNGGVSFTLTDSGKDEKGELINSYPDSTGSGTVYVVAVYGLKGSSVTVEDAVIKAVNENYRSGSVYGIYANAGPVNVENSTILANAKKWHVEYMKLEVPVR